MARNVVFGGKCPKNGIFYRKWLLLTKTSLSESHHPGADDRKASNN